MGVSYYECKRCGECRSEYEFERCSHEDCTHWENGMLCVRCDQERKKCIKCKDMFCKECYVKTAKKCGWCFDEYKTWDKIQEEKAEKESEKEELKEQYDKQYRKVHKMIDEAFDVVNDNALINEGWHMLKTIGYAGNTDFLNKVNSEWTQMKKLKQNLA